MESTSSTTTRRSILIPPHQQATASMIQSSVERRNWGRVRAIAESYQPAALARTPSRLANQRPGRQADGMAKPLAKIVALITPKRRLAALLSRRPTMPNPWEAMHDSGHRAAQAGILRISVPFPG
jgi:hypothetical protein